MAEWLCRRYLTVLNTQSILTLSKDEIDQRCRTELAFLECLAFNTMKNNTIIIQPSLLRKALKEAKVSLQDHPHILNIGILKSFSKLGLGTQVETNKDHYFVHPTFQEYFAARYLANALKESPTAEIIGFIKHQKYNRHYTLLFTFTSGLLSENDAISCSDIFWANILGEPLDLVGIKHMQLLISCMQETITESTVPQQTELLESIANCIKYSFNSKGEIIRGHLLKSLRRAQAITCGQTIINMLIDLIHYNAKDTEAIMSFLLELEISNPSTLLIIALTNKLDDDNEQVRQKACKIFGKMGEKVATAEVISMLVRALGDKSHYVRGNACEALGTMGEKAATCEVITKLVSALGDDSENVRRYACESLEEMGEKAAMNEVIPKLVSALGDENDYVRGNACKALGTMGEKAATNEVITKLVSALGDQSNDVRKHACEALGKMGEKAATNEVITKLVSALGDENDYVRGNACKALGTMGEKAATYEVITKLVSALGDESEDVRRYACESLEKMGEKAATNEVITKLVSALGDQSDDVRGNACEALGKMGEKAAMNEVITKLVCALGDENDYVRARACGALGGMSEKAATNEVITKLASALGDENDLVRVNACRALGKMSEKAATNEVIHELVVVMNNDTDYVNFAAAQAVGNILSSFAVVKQLTPKIVTDLCLCIYASHCLRNVSEDELIKVYLITGNPDWLPAVTLLTLLNGTAVTAAVNKVVLYGKTEPAELHIPNLELRHQLIEAFTDQAKRLGLFFEMPWYIQVKSEG
jgi:HEAT repeat protein